jgi:TonB-dependent receptor
LTPNNKISIMYMPNISGVNDSRYQIGINPSDEVGLGQEQRTQRYLERTMNVYQVRGEHFLDNFKDIKINWSGSYTSGIQTTPDLRVFTNSFEELPGGTVYFDSNGNDITTDAEALLSDGENLNEYYPGYTTETSQETTTAYSIRDNLYPSPTRYYRQMVDNTLDLKLNVDIPFDNSIGIQNKISFGGSLVSKNRVYTEQRYSFIGSNISYNGTPSDYFQPDNMQIVPGSSNGYIYLRDDTDLQNSYTATQTVAGVYGMLDWNLSKKLRINAGVRAETTQMLLESEKIANEDLSDEAASEFRGTMNLVDVLPAFNLTYELRKFDLSTTNLRIAASQSVARPMFREKAPYSVFDFEVQEQQTGNTDLGRTLINNYDLRLEHFPGLGEIISLSLFYKQFDQPIEQVINSTAANVEITWENVDKAVVYGAEFEVRKSLAGLGEFWQPFGVGFNLTLVQSQTTIDEEELSLIRATDSDHADTRPMYGQSPYILNSIVSYDNDSIGLNVALSFNIAGPKLVLVTKGGTPDIYEMPRGTMDLSMSKTISERFSVGFKARNLLNPKYQKTYTFKGVDYDWQSYQLGRTFTLGFTYRM